MHILFVCFLSSYHKSFIRDNCTASIITTEKSILSDRTNLNLYEQIYLVESLDNHEKIHAYARQENDLRKVNTVISFAEEYYPTGLLVSKYIEATFFPNPNVVRYLQDKLLVRHRLTDNKLNSVRCTHVKTRKDIKKFIRTIQKSVILKPRLASGSRAVIKIESESDIDDALSYYEIWAEGQPMMLEELVCGIEYSVEMFSENSSHYFIALIQKLISPVHFVGIGHLFPAEIDVNLKLKIIKFVKDVLTCLNIENGPSHTEVIVNSSGNIYLIETHIRSGGARIREMLDHTLSLDPIDLWAKQYHNEKIADYIAKIPPYTKGAAIYFDTPKTKGVINQVDVSEALSLNGVIDAGNYRPLGRVSLGVAHHSRMRIAFIMTEDKNTLEALRVAKIAARKIRYSINEQATE